MHLNTSASTRLALLVARSQIHVGTGDALGDIDRPVARNVVTGHPCLPDSALKRAVKDAQLHLTPRQADSLFGTSEKSAGMLGTPEAALLLLPVACGAGSWVWVTSPAVLERFCRHARHCGVEAPSHTLAEVGVSQCLVDVRSSAISHLSQRRVLCIADHLLFPEEDVNGSWGSWASWLTLMAYPDDDPTWQKRVATRTVLIHDVMMDRLAERLCVRSRNKVSAAGKAENLWREESLPEDAVFYSVLTAQALQSHVEVMPDARAALQALRPGPLQIGGLSSLGKGLMDFHLLPCKPSAPPLPVGEGSHDGTGA